MNRDIPVFPKGHLLHVVIVFDREHHSYYNKQTDIFLFDNDMKSLGLKHPKEFPSDDVPSAPQPGYFLKEQE